MNIPHDTTAWARFLAISPYTARLGIEADAAEDGGCVLALPYRPDFVGDPDNGVEPGTAFADIPDSWVCPECGAEKDQFEPVED